MDRTSQTLLMGAESKIRLPDVEEALRLGYAFYAADDPDFKDSKSQELAQSSVQQFLALKARDDVEEAYLSALKTTVLGLARGLRRRKDARNHALLRAEGERRERLSAFSKARNESIWLQYFWLTVRSITVWLLGYVAAQVVAFLVPNEIAAETGTKLPGVLAGFAFVCVWRWLLGFIGDQRRNAIELLYMEQRYQADNEYNTGRLTELRAYYTSLRGAWKQYTGEEYPETFSYANVIETDIFAMEQAERRRKNGTTTALAVRLARIARWRFRRKLTPSSTVRT